MTKQYAIQVEMGEQSKMLFTDERLQKLIQDYTAILFQGATTGPIPAVRVFQCVDAKDEDLSDFAKDVELRGA